MAPLANGMDTPCILASPFGEKTNVRHEWIEQSRPSKPARELLSMRVFDALRRNL
jgi:hypothetical protein